MEYSAREIIAVKLSTYAAAKEAWKSEDWCSISVQACGDDFSCIVLYKLLFVVVQITAIWSSSTTLLGVEV